MMFWYDHGVGGWGWLAMSVGMIVFWAVVITVAVLLFRALSHRHDHDHAVAAPTPEQVLADRFARGEIEEEEYRRRLSVLQTTGRPAPR
ncbi:SHOCT domain-containing protein [Streptacidiphilus griseoplanus]|uniref:SHOCT domain-containing protein n=1 Tax=Peterkaempfera griseoplana TaxID=66896 RepID=UPI000AD003D9|nr:SHOCT domain-containing protein [Peterkaempfera griseoplana]